MFWGFFSIALQICSIMFTYTVIVLFILAKLSVSRLIPLDSLALK